MTDSSSPSSPSDSTGPAPVRPSEGGWLGSLRRYDVWWSILLILFCITAACGLPLLWGSHAFRLPGKVFWSIVVLLYTLLLLWIFFVVMWWSISRIMEAFAVITA